MDWRRSPWVIPVASVLPAAAIAYAFALGPSPEKLARTQRAQGTAALPVHTTDGTVP